jgi:hypothetical protein
MTEKKNSQELIASIDLHIQETRDKLKELLSKVHELAKTVVREHNDVEKDSRFLVSSKLHPVRRDDVNLFTQYLYTKDGLGYYIYDFFNPNNPEFDEKSNLKIYETDIYTAYCVLTAQTQNMNFYMNQDTKGIISGRLIMCNNYANTWREMIKKIEKNNA